MSDWTVKLDVKVREVDVPPTVDEVIRAVKQAMSSDWKPVQTIEMTRYTSGESEKFPIDVEIGMLQLVNDSYDTEVPVE